MSSKSITNTKLRRKILRFYFKIKYLTIILICIFLLFFFYSSVFNDLKDKLNNLFVNFTFNIGSKLEHVVLENNVHLTLEDIHDILLLEKYSPLFQLNLKKIYKKLHNHPLIESVIIERQLPNKLHISIKEKIPVAFWQCNKKIMLIDQDGQVIKWHDLARFKNLLYVIGESANLYIKQLQADLLIHEDFIRNIRYAVRIGNRRWNLILENNLKVEMPEKNFLVAYDYLYNLFLQEKLLNSGYKILDLRDDLKFYLKKD